MTVYIFQSFNELDYSKYKHLASRNFFFFLKVKLLFVYEATMKSSLPSSKSLSSHAFNPSKEEEIPLSMKTRFTNFVSITSDAGQNNLKNHTAKLGQKS